VGPTAVGQRSGGQSTDPCVNIVPFDLGALLVRAESTEVKGRLFACLQD
jgi:hypothetical protein